MDGSHVAVGFLVVTGLCLVAFAMRVLDWKGSIAAWILGFLVVVCGEVSWLIPMGVFTGTSFLATRYGKAQKAQFMPEESERGWRNVVANGTAAAIAVLLVPTFGAPAIYAYVAALSSVAADTWASEIGALSRRARSILPPFPDGTRGANGMVSALGQFAAVTGAAVVSVSAFWAMGLDWAWIWIPILAGFVGSQLDSLLGATMENHGALSNAWVNFVASLMPTLAVFIGLRAAGA